MKRAILLAFIAAILLCGCSGEEEETSVEEETTVTEVLETEPETEPEVEEIYDETLTVHFIDVGEGDAILATCGKDSMLIDGGTDSSLIYSYLSKNSIDHLTYIVCTHPHEDHVGGLAGALNYATVDAAYCSYDDYDLESFKDFEKYLGEQGKTIIVPKPGDTLSLGNAELEFLGPITDSTSENDMSLVMKLTLDDVSFLLTGDMEKDESQSLVDSGVDLSCTVLKVGHHGSDTSTSQKFLELANPSYAVISVGDNSYGHPADSVLRLLSDKSVSLYRTDMLGDIICNTDGSTVSFNCDAVKYTPPAPAPEPEPEPEPVVPVAVPDPEPTETEIVPDVSQVDYVLNTNTHKFHYPTCSSVETIKEKNRQDFSGTREEVIGMGFEPCGRCNP